jgi:hypothetical protein
MSRGADGVGGAIGRVLSAAGSVGGGTGPWGLVRYLAMNDRSGRHAQGEGEEEEVGAAPPLFWFKYQSKPPDGQVGSLTKSITHRQYRLTAVEQHPA